jgi:hypothetical protein
MGRTHDVTISAFDLDRLEVELLDERVLADRLANALLDTMSAWITSPNAVEAAEAIAQWREVRSES